MELAIVDIETTGGSPVYHRVVEIGIVLWKDGEVVERYQTLINPEQWISPQLTQIHGITNEMVESAPTFSEVAEAILERLENRIFVAHNVNFDYGFIKAEMNRAGYLFDRKRICSVRLSRKLVPGLKSYSLKSLCQHFGVINQKAHRALEDAEATAGIVGELMLLPEAPAVVTYFLKQTSKETSLPPNLEKEKFLGLPTSMGVYLFHDQHGKVLYVGKAKHLRDRVGQHFGSHTHTKARSEFLNSIFDVSYEVCGHELMALLLENELIKKHYPRFNRANKDFRLNHGIFAYEDQHGYLRLRIGDAGKWSNPVAVYRSIHEASSLLLQTTMQLGLCLIRNGLVDPTPTGCAYETVDGRRCLICEGATTTEEYNNQVLKAQKTLSEGQTLLLKTTGRDASESGAVWVDKGKIKGYGYVPSDAETTDLDSIKPYLKSYYDTQDAQSILKMYLPKARKMGMIENEIGVFAL